MIEVEPMDESGGCGDGCRNQTRTIWGFVHEDQGTIAGYTMQYTVGASHEKHPANVDLIYGQWGDGTSSSDRCALSLLYFATEIGPGVMVIDATKCRVGSRRLAFKALSRDEVIETDLATHVFAIFDAVITQDKRAMLASSAWALPAPRGLAPFLRRWKCRHSSPN
ncbi:MAG: hypothetical protein AAGC92_12090 [Pseudomonadota bacterium]